MREDEVRLPDPSAQHLTAVLRAASLGLERAAPRWRRRLARFAAVAVLAWLLLAAELAWLWRHR